MELLNFVEIETESRYVPVEIYHGDITNIEYPVDLLITSAFKGGYHPTHNSVLGALFKNLSINIQ